MGTSLQQQPSKSVIASFLAGFMVLGAASGAAATEPSVSGLWQKIDGETGRPVGWFLFVDGNVYSAMMTTSRPNKAIPR